MHYLTGEQYTYLAGEINALYHEAAVKAGISDSGFHYSLDLLPTMAQLLGVKPWENWDGESFAETVTDGKAAGRDSLVLSQMAHVCQRSARFGDWLYVRTYHDGFHLFDREMLFNLREDPHEQHDVKDAHPELCAQGAKIPMMTVLHEDGPYHTHGHLDEYIERLEKTGRKAGADALRKKYKRG